MKPTALSGVALIGLLLALTAAPALGQQSAVVRATARVAVSVEAENRSLVSNLAREWSRHRPGVYKIQGSLAVVRLRVVGASGPERSVASKPVAMIDVQYLRN